MIHPAILVGLSYLIGSIPAAYLAGKLTRGIDLREHGSGNLGATNVYRVLGPRIALVVLLVDALKGAIPVLVFPGMTAASRPDLWAIAYAVAAIAGHVRSIFLLLRGGGKGVATDRKSTRLNSSHGYISYAVFCLKKKTNETMPY